MYLARETVGGYYTSSNVDVYLLTRQRYRDRQDISLYDDTDLESSIKGVPSGKWGGNRLYVERDKTPNLTGHFKIKTMVPANDPIVHFRNQSIDRSKYNLYEAEHKDSATSKPRLCRVFSEVVFFKGEDIPASEVSTLQKIGSNDPLDYYVHSKVLFDQRAVSNLFPGLFRKKSGTAP